VTAGSLRKYHDVRGADIFMSATVPGVKVDFGTLGFVSKRFDLTILDNQVLVDVFSECLL